MKKNVNILHYLEIIYHTYLDSQNDHDGHKDLHEKWDNLSAQCESAAPVPVLNDILVKLAIHGLVLLS